MLSLYSSLSSARSGLRSIVKSGLQLFYKVNVTSGSVLDRSRNSNDGTLYSGKALNFDGTGDSVTVGDTGIDMKTVAFWIFVADVTSNTEQIMEFKTDHGINSVNGTITTAGTFTGEVIYVNGSAGSSISASTWSRIVITTTAAIDVNQLVFGTDGSSSGTFVIADFQLYDKTWTASDVEFDYNNPDKDVFDNSNSSIVVTDCKSLLRLNEGAGDRVYDAAPVLGVEEVTNGDFSSSDNWTLQPAWSISNNKALYDDSDEENIQQELSVSAGKTYQLSFDISDCPTSARIRIYFGTEGTSVLPETSRENGSYVVTFTPSTADSNLTFKGFVGGDIFSLSNVSLKEIKPPESFAIVGDKTFVHQQPSIPQYAMSSFSKKMVFTDVNTDVDVGAQSIADDQAFSFSFWYAQADDSSLENYILAKHDSTDDYIRFNNQNESLEFKVNGGTAITYDISDLTDFKTSHIVLTRASGANPITKCYVNGILEVTDTSSNADGVFEYQQIGAGGTSNAGTFFLDELAHFNKELSLTEVQEIFNSGTALDCRDHSSVSNLEGYWRNNGADTWTDLSTNSNNGTVNGSPTEIFLQEVPFFGKDSLGMFMNKPRLGGLNFNKSGYVETGSTFQSTFRDSFSICFWFKFPDGQPSLAMRFLGHDAGNNDLFISLEADGKSKFQFQSNSDRVISKTDAAIASNNQTDWIYLTITLTKASTIGDAQIIFYKDGSAVDSSLVGTETLTQANMELYTQDQNLVLGAFNNEGTIDTDTCDGIIDDFKIYSKALTAAEISKNYNATKGRHKN